MKKLVKEWLRYAEADLLTIEKIHNEELLTNVIVFHSHQCIEKSFKAVILDKTGKIPQIHNLLRLYGTVRNYEKIKFETSDLEKINEAYIDTRYPSDLGLLPEGQISLDHAIRYITLAKSIFLQVKKSF